MIDEKKLIENFRKCYCGHSEMENSELLIRFKGVCNIINNQPKIGEWIPCSVKLPPQPKENPIFDNKPLELYIVDCGGDYPFRAFWNGDFFTDGWSKIDVVAWQPLPTPYVQK